MSNARAWKAWTDRRWKLPRIGQPNPWGAWDTLERSVIGLTWLGENASDSMTGPPERGSFRIKSTYSSPLVPSSRKSTSERRLFDDVRDHHEVSESEPSPAGTGRAVSIPMQP